MRPPLGSARRRRLAAADEVRNRSIAPTAAA
jgi:hypothetical protein